MTHEIRLRAIHTDTDRDRDREREREMTAPDDTDVHGDAVEEEGGGEEEEEEGIDASGIDFDEDGNVVGVKSNQEEMTSTETQTAAAAASASASTGVQRHPRASVYGGITSPDRCVMMIMSREASRDDHVSDNDARLC